MEENTLSVLQISPGQYPKQVEIDNDLKALQQAVGGSIGATYLVVGLGEEDFASLTPELAQKYEKQFHQPEDFIQLGHRMMVIRVPDEAVRPEKNKAAPSKDAGLDR